MWEALGSRNVRGLTRQLRVWGGDGEAQVQRPPQRGQDGLLAQTLLTAVDFVPIEERGAGEAGVAGRGGRHEARGHGRGRVVVIALPRLQLRRVVCKRRRGKRGRRARRREDEHVAEFWMMKRKWGKVRTERQKEFGKETRGEEG